MFSNPLNRLGRAFSFRLNLWYASIFTLSACALYFFLYVLLAVAMGNKDREVIESQMKARREAAAKATLDEEVARAHPIATNGGIARVRQLRAQVISGKASGNWGAVVSALKQLTGQPQKGQSPLTPAEKKGRVAGTS